MLSSYSLLSIVPIVAKTIREDGEVNFIDIDCPDDKSLLHPLIPKTTIQRIITMRILYRFMWWARDLWAMSYKPS